jgi:alpha-L-fucosidase
MSERRVLPEGAANAANGGWCRAWSSADMIVVVADDPDAVRVDAPGREVVRFALPS